MANEYVPPIKQQYQDTFNRKVAELTEARERLMGTLPKYTPTDTPHAGVNVGASMDAITNARTPQEDAAYAQADAIVKQSEADKTDGSGILTTANLNSANPFVSLPTNAINAAALAIGGLAKISTNTAALLADDLPRIYQSIGTPTPVADAYNRYVASNEQRNALGQQAAQVDRLLAKGTINPVEAAARKVELQTQAKNLVTSDEDWALLNQRNSLTTNDSYLEQLDNAQLNIQEAKVRRGQVEGDTTSDAIAALRGLGNRNAYRSISEANKGNEEIKALDDLATQQFAEGNWIRGTGNTALATGKAALNVIGAGIKNPLGSLNLAAEMFPQLINPYVTLASSAGAAGEQNVNSLEQYQKREGKTVASQGEGLGMLGLSVGYGVMDAVSDRLMAKGFQGQTNATRALADVVPKTTAKAALGIITKPVTKTLQAAIPEAITEGAQTAIEDSYGSLGTSYDSASVGTGAGLGALVSGVLQGKNSIKAGVQEAALDIALSRPKGLEAIERAKQRRATDAIPTEELTDITHPNYNPTVAVQRFGAELTADSTPEQAIDIKNRINEVTSNIESKIGGLQQLIDDYPVELAKIERNKVVFDNARAAALADGDNDLINALNEKQAAREQIFNDQFPNFDMDKATATLKSLQQDLLQTDKFASSFNTIIDSRFPDAVNASKQAQNAPMSDSVEPVVQTPVNGSTEPSMPITPPPVGTLTQDENGIISSSSTTVSEDTNATPTTVTDQSVPDVSTPIEPVQQSKKDFDDIVSSYPSESTSIAASKLADDTSNDLTDSQRTTLRKLSDAIVVANRTKTLGDVSKDVTEGSKGYRGLNQYISSMMNAVRAGKKAVQSALVSDINSFNDDHAEKAQLARQAMDMAPKGMAQEVLRTKSGWELGKQIPMSQAMSKKYQAEMHKSGSLAIHSGSETIVKGIEDESSAISVVADTLKAIQESQQAPKQPSKAQEDTLEQELEQLTGKKVVVPTEASKPTPATKEQAAVTKAEPRVEAKPVTGKAEPVKKEPTAQEALDQFNEQDRAERQAKNETRQAKAIPVVKSTKQLEAIQELKGVNKQLADIKDSITEILNQDKTKLTADQLVHAKSIQEAYYKYLEQRGDLVVAATGLQANKTYIITDIVGVLPLGTDVAYATHLQTIFSKLAAIAPNTKLVIVSNAASIKDLRIREAFIEETSALQGMYSRTNNTIYLQASSEDILETAVHELQHVVTSHATKTMDSALKDRAMDILVAAKLAFNKMEKAGVKNLDRISYSLTNIDELIAEGVANKYVVEFLKSVKMNRNTALEKLVGVVGDFFGLSEPEVSAYEALVELTAKVEVLNKPLLDALVNKLADEAKPKLDKVSELDDSLFEPESYMDMVNTHIASQFQTDPNLEEIQLSDNGFAHNNIMDLQVASLVNKQGLMSRYQWEVYQGERAKRMATATLLEEGQVQEVGKVHEAKVSHDESVPVEETPIVTSEDSADIQPEVVNTEAIEPVVEAKPVKGITAIQATKEERTKLQEEVLVDNGKTITGFQRTNLVKAYFTQKGSSILATTKDLVSSLTDGGLDLMTKVLGNKPTTEQVNQMKSLIDFIQSQQKSYKDLMKNSTGTTDTSDDFKYRDYLQYLYEGTNPELEENIMTAASVASYTWLLENGGKFYATQEQVAGMLGQPNLKSIPYPIYQQFNTAGKDRGAVIRSLGSRAYEALGLSITKDTDPVHKDKLVNALGAMAYQTLLDQGYLQLTPMTGTMVQGARRTIAGESLPDRSKMTEDQLKKDVQREKTEASTTHFYVRAAHNVTVKDKKEESSGVINKIKFLQDAAKGTDGLMTKLFGVTNREVMPVTKKPTELTQKVVDDAGTEVASHLAENVLKAMQTPHQVSNLATVYGLLEESDRDAFLGMIGYVSDADLEKMHISNRESQQAINESILRSIENMKTSLQMLQLNDLGDYSDFYLPLKVWAVNRAGVVSNMLNEQGDKIHRSMTHIKSHKQEVTIGDSIVNGQITQYGYFLLGVAGGMEGTKSIVGNTSDKTTAAEFLPNFEAYIASQPVQNAIESMVAIKSGNYTSIDVKIVAAMNKEFGMNAMSMASLNALAEMSQAKDGKFTTTISLESDGVTSGSAISVLLYGVTDYGLMAASGFFHKDDPTPNINTYRDNGGQDTYEITGMMIKKVWRKLVSITNIPVTVVQGFAYFDPSFGERKGAKGVQTPLIYGSGFAAINRANTSELITHIYSKLEAIANMPVGEASQEALKGFVTQYNALANYANSFPGGQKMDTVALSTFPNVHALLNFQLEGYDEKRLHNMNSETRGKAIEAAVERVSGEMLKTRSNLFAMTGAGFGAYNSLFEAVRAGMEADLFAKGELPFRTDKNNNKVLLSGLSPEHIEDVFKLLSPFNSSVVTAEGVVSTNSKESSMPTYNIKRVPNDAAVAKSEHKFKRAPFIGKAYTSKSITGVKPALSIGTQAQTWVLESKGAAVSATLVQGVDAYVSMTTQALHDSAGHHDANTGSVDGAVSMAQTQNKAVIDALIKFHASTNALQAILPPLRGHIDPSLSQYVTPKMIADVRSSTIADINFYTKGKYTTLEAALNAVVAKSYEADFNKLNMIEQLGTISQYSLEGGQTSISDEQLAAVKEERTKLLKQQKEDYASVQAIVKGFSSTTSKQSTNKPSTNVPTQEVVVQQVPVAEPVTVEVSTRNTTEQFLDKYDGKNIPHNELFNFLREGLKGKKGWYSAGQRSLLELVVKALPTNVPISVVTATSAPKDTRWYQGDPNHESRAWASTDHVVYRLDRDTINSEVVLHELVHAITLGGLRNTVNGFVVKQLQELSDIAKTQYDSIKDKSIYTEAQQAVFKEAFSDLNEFVSIAMSNRDMQNFLDQIIIPRTEAKPGLATMFQKFIKSIGSILNKAAGRTTPLDSNTQSVLEATIYNTTQVIQTQFNDARNQGFDLQSSYPHEQAKADALKRATQYTAREVFNVLDGSGISSEFNVHLTDVITTVVDNSFSILEAHDLTSSDTAGYTPYQVWNEKLSQGKVPYASTALATGFNLSEKELFAVEAIEASLNAAMNNGVGTAVHKELKAAFLKARDSLKDERVFFAGDWSKASQQQRDQALAKYNLVFKLVGNTNKQEENAYLSRFAALALGSQEFSALLDFPVYTQENRGDKSLSSSISNYFDTAMQWVNGYLSKTLSNQTIKDKLPILAQQLIEIDHKKRDAALPGILEKIGVAQEVGNEVIQGLSEKLADTFKGVRGTKVVQTVLKGKVMDNLDVLKDARNKDNPNSVLGVAAELLNELSDPNTAQQGMQKLFRKHEVVQQTRKGMISAMTTNILNTFIDGGKNLKQAHLEAVTYGLLRTNAQALLSTYGVRGIQDFVGDTAKRNAEITKLEKQVSNPLHINRTRDLAWYMASGEPRDSITKNTTNILRDMGTGKELAEDQVSKESIELLDKLNALYAIEYTRSDRREALKQLITGELARKGVNGIEATLAYHRGLVEDSRDTLFEGNSVSRIQGWLPEIVNQHREIAIATTEADARELERLGFHLHSQPKTDPNDPVSGTRKVYMTEESTKTRYTTGAMSLTTTARKGTSVFTGSDVKGKAAYQAIDKMNKRTAAYLAKHTDPNYDPRKGNTSMIPTYANDGSIIDYNYEMSHESRDSLLQRNNNFAAVLGAYAGTNYDKLESPKHNATVLEAIHNEFLEGYAKSPEAYVEISPHANDPRLREIYAMLPHDAKQSMEKLWGKGEPMMIRNDLLLSTFGAHKLTIGSAFDKNPEHRNMIEITVVSTLEAMFGDTAKLKGLRAERAWQEVALTMKSFVVIRNVKTLLGNQMSNMGILVAMGVNPINVYQDSAIALKGALQYRKDTAIIINANQQLRAGLGIPSEHHQDILRAQDSLARNPVRDFIAAGMLTSIVEDVSLEEDPYSYKSKYAQRLDEMTSGIPDGVKTGLSYAFVSPKTPLYQLLADATQFSDFTAKYALYKHSTTRAKKKLSHDEAISLADKMFINYGVPTSPELQYMNDMGFLMFTKYTLRIQRAMAHLLKEHPAGALGQTLLASQLGGVSVLDPLFLNNIGNPLRTGALGMPSVIDEPFPVAMLKGLLF